MFGTPCSMAVGISGAALSRVGEFTETMRILPDWWKLKSWPVTFGDMIGMWPLTRSAMPGPAPL